jgi:YHS domain-containing protein
MKSLKTLGKSIVTVMAVLSLTALVANAEDKKAPPTPDKLTTCPVSGDKLGEMDKPFVFEYKGREVKLCCKDCKKDFDKDPAKYMKKIEAADKDSKAK